MVCTVIITTCRTGWMITGGAVRTAHCRPSAPGSSSRAIPREPSPRTGRYNRYAHVTRGALPVFAYFWFPQWIKPGQCSVYLVLMVLWCVFRLWWTWAIRNHPLWVLVSGLAPSRCRLCSASCWESTQRSCSSGTSPACVFLVTPPYWALCRHIVTDCCTLLSQWRTSLVN